MQILYNLLIHFVGFALNIVAIFNKKIHLFVEGRKHSISLLKEKIKPNDTVIWVHCASLGEFEQGRPIIEKLKKLYPSKKIVLTFFSPSGYEVRKNYEIADAVVYLPLDTKQNVSTFLDVIHPEVAIFVKYEFWPNYLFELKRREINTILISGIFRESQSFFKWHGGFMKKALHTFSHFFVQDENSKLLLNSIHFENVTISGDTRFDRVFEITQQNNELSFISEFKNDHLVLVAGSTWKDDEDLLVKYINNSTNNQVKFIIAPHNINAVAIEQLKSKIQKKAILFSEKEGKDLNTFQVFIIDTIGILTKIYSYAHIAYVGGGYTKSGVHNVLEPATFGMPIVIGPNYHKFKEAIDLVHDEACFNVDTYQKLSVLLSEFFENRSAREKAGLNAKTYVESKIGATDKILNYLK